MPAAKKTRRDMYQEITDRIIECLSQDTIPWRKPWKGGGMSNPRSVNSGKAYRGINWFNLMMAGEMYSRPWWITFRDAKNNGGSVRKGEKGFPVVYFSFFDEKKNGKKTGNKIPMLRHFTVFNIDQCDMPDEFIAELDRKAGMTQFDEPETDNVPAETVDAAIELLKTYMSGEGITLTHGALSAYYAPMLDQINMPGMEHFINPESYASVLAHECIHSTGHSSRLDRGNDTRKRGGKDEQEMYSREELVAEMGASYFSAMTGISTAELDENRDAYIQNWIKALKDDPKMIIWAASRATKAADMVLGIVPETTESEETSKTTA